MLLTPAVLLLLVVAGWLWYSARVESQIEAELQKISQRGEPASVEELQARYALPADSVDNTQQWLDVINEFVQAEQMPAYENYILEGPGYYEVPSPGEPWPGEPVVAQHFRELEPAIEKLSALAKAPEAMRYPLVLNTVSFEEAGELSSVRSLARSLSLQARWHVYHGRQAEALQALLLGRRVAETIEPIPLSFGQLMYIAHCGIMTGTILDLLPHANWTDQQLQTLQAEMQITRDPYQLVHFGFSGDRIESRAKFDEPEKYLEEVPATYRWTRRTDELYYLQTYARLLAVNQLPVRQARQQSELIQEELDQDSELHKFRYPLTRAAIPWLSAMREGMERFVLAERATATLIACQRYRLEHDSWPAKLTDLTPRFMKSIPVDPFSLKPLRYERFDKGVVIVSVGRDLTDDNALAEFESEENVYSPDIIFLLKPSG